MNKCAIGKDGKLLDAADIQWFHDADDAHPIPPTTSEVSNTSMYADQSSRKFILT